MKSKIVESLRKRLQEEITPQNPLRYLQDHIIEDYIDSVISTVYLYTRPKKGTTNVSIYLVELIAAIGHGVRGKLKQKRNSALAAKTGAFLLYSFEEIRLIEVTLGAGAKGHASYVVNVVNDDAICSLWGSLAIDKVEKLPSETPYAPWTSHRHETGAIMVKTGNKAVLESLSPESHPLVFTCINKAQTVGWNINRDIYDIHLWALRNKTDAFADIWEQQNPEAKTTKMREAKAIGSVAKRFLGKTFFHLYYFDFRGRKYPTTAYLHEQGSDLARSMLLQAAGEPMTADGFWWLLVATASNWAGDAGRPDGLKTDKIPLKERYEWALDNEEILLSYAESPKVNQGWMKADKPWQFLACCNELRKLREWQVKQARRIGLQGWEFFENYEYVSGFEAYIDGSNNGSQHLAALTKDEITAPHVNLVPSDLPGDLYKYVGDHVWITLNNTVAMYTVAEVFECEQLILQLVELKKRIQNAEPRSEVRKFLVEEIRTFKEKNDKMLAKAGPVYWLQIHDAKHKRKIVKRNVMTLPYGGTAYGLGQQQIDDAKKHGIDLLLYLEHRWGSYLGREVYEDCKSSLKRPMRLLSVFEQAGKKAEQENRFLSWTVPVTNFPVVQNYVEGKTKKIWVQYGPPIGERKSSGYYVNTLQLAVCFLEDVVPSRNRQSQGASPNAIHSLDAGHLTITVSNCDFNVTTIHDSFGCLLAHMPKLFRIVRESFVQLYAADPLSSLMKDIGGDISSIELGTLDITLFLDSEYGFS